MERAARPVGPCRSFTQLADKPLDMVRESSYHEIEFCGKRYTDMAEKLTPRKQQALEMRSRIQTIALDLFDKMGFENVSVEEIAQASGCSVGNIYHYFKSKDELAIQVTGHVDAAYLQLEDEYLRDADRSAREKLLDFVGQSLQISASDPVLYNEHRVYFRVLAELVELCRAEGFIRSDYETDAVVEFLVTLQRGMLMEWRIYEGEFDIARRGVAMAAVLLDGLTK